MAFGKGFSIRKQFVIKSAVLCAFSPVAAAVPEDAAHQTLPGIADAQRSVDKDLDPDFRLLRDGPDFFKVQLPAEDGGADPEGFQFLYVIKAVGGQLG